MDSLEKQQINIYKYGRSYLSSFYLYTNLIDTSNKLSKHNNNQRKPKKKITTTQNKIKHRIFTWKNPLKEKIMVPSPVKSFTIK